MNDPKGYTLIELAIVVLILALSAGILIPRFTSGIFVNDLKAGMRRIKAVVSEARSTAMVSGNTVYLVFDLDRESEANCYWLLAPEEVNATEEETGNCLPSGLRIKDIQTDQLHSSGKVSLGFLPNGLARPALIRLTSGDDVYTLSIKPFNARIDIFEGEKTFSTLRGEAGGQS